MNDAQVFKALGDPTRLKIIKRLSVGNQLNISSVSYELGITRQGVRRHLQVLINAHVIISKPKGRDVMIHLNPVVLERAKKYIEMLEQQWDTRLDSLRSYVESKT